MGNFSKFSDFSSDNERIRLEAEAISVYTDSSFFENQVMNVKETAKFLRISTRTVYEKAKCGLIPHQKIGSKYVFLRSELVRFLQGE